MRIETTRFGAVEVPEEEVLRLPEGLVGLPGLTRFLLLEGEAGTPFQWLQSVDEPSLAFVVIDPKWLHAGLAEELPQAVKDRLGGGDPGEVAALVLVTIPEDPREMTANLKGPIVFHRRTRQGVQLVLDDERFLLRHPLLSAAAKG